MKRIILVLLALVLLGGVPAMATGCDRQADRASYNVSKEADNFNVTRRLVVTNVSYMSGPVQLYELTANFSINHDEYDGQLEVISEVHTDDGETIYKKDFIRLNEYVTYVVEDLSGAGVTPYKYQMVYMPEMIQPITVTTDQ